MLNKDNPDRVKIDIEKAKDWILKGAQPSSRVKIFLSSLGVVEKPIITEKTKKHLPKKKTKDAKAEDAKPADAKPADAKAEDAKAADVKIKDQDK